MSETEASLFITPVFLLQILPAPVACGEGVISSQYVMIERNIDRSNVPNVFLSGSWRT